jgi:hypothetical protein
MIGRRIPVEPGKFPSLELPGDYAGPIMGFTGPVPAVFFYKPNSRDPKAPRIARSVQHVVSPPHSFTEEPDGSLTIMASLGDMHDGESDGWHGYLIKGVWSQI